MLKNLKVRILLVIYILTLIYWSALYFTHTSYNSLNYFYQLMLSFIPLAGGAFGMLNVMAWGSLKSKVGRGIFFISLGLITWGIGQLIWSYYTIAEIAEVPYPSLADVGYVISWPSWAYGIFNLSRATGAKFAYRKQKGKIALFIIPIIAIIISYYLLIVVARGGSIDFSAGITKVFFDLAYPVGDVIILTLGLLVFGLPFKYLGGRYKAAIVLLLLGFGLNYFADFAFSYTTTAETYYNGHWVDLMFPTVMTLLSLGVASFDPYIGRTKKSLTQTPVAGVINGQ